MANQNILDEIKNCPASPNCVSSLTKSPRHHMEPWPYSGETTAIMNLVKERTLTQKRVKLKGSGSNYFHFVFTSGLMRFKDDVWFYFDDEQKKIHFKSASRIGYSDWGVNRERMKTIKTLIF